MPVYIDPETKEEVRFWDGLCTDCKSDNLQGLGMPCDEDGVPASYLYQCNDCGNLFEILRWFGLPPYMMIRKEE